MIFLKKLLAFMAALLILAGCSGSNQGMERGIKLREKLLSANGCSFDTVITADFGDKTYSFSMQCQSDAEGAVAFTVTQPETISGISGTLSAKGGQLTFDREALAFSMLADGEISPVSGPWLLLNTLRSGYMKYVSTDDRQLRLTVDDSYEADALQLEIWLDSEDLPVSAEILWQGRRILSLQVSKFVFL